MGNDLQTVLLLYSAFPCIFRFFGLSSSDTVTTLVQSHLASFLPFSEVIPAFLRNFVFIYSKIAQYLKAYKYVKEFGEGIDCICNELETKGCAIPSFHIDAFILKATLMAEWTTEKEFERLGTA